MVSFTSQGHLPELARPTSDGNTGDRYQGLVRQLLAHLSAAGRAPTIGLTGSATGEGVTTITAQLAAGAAAILDKPTLLVDANFVQPSIERIFQLEAKPGLRDVIFAGAELPQCIHPSGISNLAVLGPGHTNASHEVVAWPDFLDEVANVFSFVLFDLPAVADLNAQGPPTNLLDGVLLVVEAERARRRAVLRAKTQLQRMQAEILGVVLNKRTNHVPGWLYNRI